MEDKCSCSCNCGGSLKKEEEFIEYIAKVEKESKKCMEEFLEICGRIKDSDTRLALNALYMHLKLEDFLNSPLDSAVIENDSRF